MGLLRKLAGQTAIYGLSSIAGRIINWGLTPLHTALFAAGEYGIYNDLISLTFSAQVILTFGMETSFFHFSSKHQDQAQTAYNQAFFWVALLTAAFVALFGLGYRPLAGALGYGDQPELVLYCVGIVAFDALAALPMARLRYRELPMRFTTINLTNIAFTVLLNLVLLLGFEADIAYVFIANLLASGVRLAMALYRNMPERFKPDGAWLKPMRRYGFFIMLAGLAGAQNEVLDRNLLPRLWTDGQAWMGQARTGLEMAGIYSAVYKLAVLIALGTQAFRYAAEPFFFKDSQAQDSRQNLRRVFHWYMLASLIMLLLIGSFAWEIVSFDAWGLLPFTLLNHNYWDGLVVVPILLAANVCMGGYINLSMWYKLTGQLRMGLLIAVVGMSITLLVNVLTIPWLGYVGSALATFLCYFVMLILCWRLGQQYYPVNYTVRRLWRYALLCVGGAWLNMLFYLAGYTGWETTLLKILIAGAIIAAIVWAERRYPALGRQDLKSNE
ncbi:MAG: lipopolysaccharide biosynthesis protein [Bacteroidetes bacterium]|nr:lipopolysaccharide biosynthesis protein [Bacteroidota bacterium]